MTDSPGIKVSGPAKCDLCKVVAPLRYDGCCALCSIRTAREELAEVKEELRTRMKLAGDVHDGLKRQVERLVLENKQLKAPLADTAQAVELEPVEFKAAK